MISRLLALATVALVLPASARAQQPSDSLPPGVTPAMVKDGEQVFKGPGLCFACHGQDARGIPNLGVDLTDSEWLHSKGTFDDIVQQIMAGVTAKESTSGTVMPPKGGSQITDAQVKAVAAYVWRLSHPPKGKG